MSPKNKALKCSQQVRKLPLETFRLPDDGRKWKQSARSRKAFLQHVSTWANPDGTFVTNGRNYSPSLKTLLEDFSRGSYTRITEALLTIGLLSWAREKHYDRRIYTIHLPETGTTFNPNQYPDSPKSGSTLDDKTKNQYPDSQNQYPDSPKSVSTSVHHPSLPSEEPSREREPSAKQKSNSSLPLSPAALEAHREAIMKRVKTLSKGKASFSKTAKRELLDVIQKLGSWTQQEMDDAIQAKLNGCSKDDPTSYVIFGSSFTSDLIASITDQRDRDAQAARATARAAKTAETTRHLNQWIDELDKVKDDLSVDLEEWYANHRPPYFEDDDEMNIHSDRLFDAALDSRKISIEAGSDESPAAHPAPPQIDPDFRLWKIKGVNFKARNRDDAVQQAQEYFQQFTLTAAAISSSSPAVLAEPKVKG